MNLYGNIGEDDKWIWGPAALAKRRGDMVNGGEGAHGDEKSKRKGDQGFDVKPWEEQAPDEIKNTDLSLYLALAWFSKECFEVIVRNILWEIAYEQAHIINYN